MIIENHGPLIFATDFWELNQDTIYFSVNAGAIRALLPRSKYEYVGEMRTADHVIYTVDSMNHVELLFDDNSDSPFVINTPPEAFDTLPAEPPAGREWVFSAWIEKKGLPHKALERRCYWRRVEMLPCLKPWGKE